MNASGKTAWLIGALENMNVEDDLAEKGYTIRKFKSEKALSATQYDDQPDMIIFSEELLHKGCLFFKINEFFPGTLAVSIGCGQPQESNEGALEESMDRLIKSLRSITKA